MDPPNLATPAAVVADVPKKEEFKITKIENDKIYKRVNITFSPREKLSVGNTVIINANTTPRLNGTYKIKKVLSLNQIQIEVPEKLTITSKSDTMTLLS